MRICVDENIPLMTVRALRGQNHDVLDVRESASKGAEDDDIWEIAHREQRLFVTTDKGFAQHRNEEHSGVLIVRLKQPNRHKIHQRVMQAIDGLPSEKWPGTVVVMRDSFREVWQARSGKG